MNEDILNPYSPPKSDCPPLKRAGGESSGKDRSLSNGSELDDGDKLVIVASFDNSIEAYTFKNVLEQNGIDSKVNNETTTAIFGLTIAGPSSAFAIEVVIRESVAEAALRVKQQFLASDNDDDSPIPEWECKCGETVDAGFEICWNCETEFKKSSAG